MFVGQPVTYVSIHDAMCDAQGCLTTVADSPADVLSWDGHLTTAGAAYVAERLLW